MRLMITMPERIHRMNQCHYTRSNGTSMAGRRQQCCKFIRTSTLLVYHPPSTDYTISPQPPLLHKTLSNRPQLPQVYENSANGSHSYCSKAWARLGASVYTLHLASSELLVHMMIDRLQWKSKIFFLRCPCHFEVYGACSW